MTSSGSKRIVEGDYVQTLPQASNDWHYVKITAQPGSDKVLSFFNTHLHSTSHFPFQYFSSSPEKVFLWKNKAGVEWELVLIDEKETENGVPMLVFKVGHYSQKVDRYFSPWTFIKKNTSILTNKNLYRQICDDPENIVGWRGLSLPTEWLYTGAALCQRGQNWNWRTTWSLYEEELRMKYQIIGSTQSKTEAIKLSCMWKNLWAVKRYQLSCQCISSIELE